MYYLNSFEYNDISFDDFHTYPSKMRKEILNDSSLIEIMLKKNINDRRFRHSKSVALLASELASIHHIDTFKAYMTGLLHDCTKDFDEEFHDSYLKYYDPDMIEMPKECKHSFTAKYYLKDKLNYQDKDILNAIYNHTICRSRDKLSMIIYIADKREPLREINDNIIDIARYDLYEAFKRLNWSVERYLREVKNERIIK